MNADDEPTEPTLMVGRPDSFFTPPAKFNPFAPDVRKFCLENAPLRTRGIVNHSSVYGPMTVPTKPPAALVLRKVTSKSDFTGST